MAYYYEGQPEYPVWRTVPTATPRSATSVMMPFRRIRTPSWATAASVLTLPAIRRVRSCRIRRRPPQHGIRCLHDHDPTRLPVHLARWGRAVQRRDLRVAGAGQTDKLGPDQDRESLAQLPRFAKAQDRVFQWVSGPRAPKSALHFERCRRSGATPARSSPGGRAGSPAPCPAGSPSGSSVPGWSRRPRARPRRRSGSGGIHRGRCGGCSPVLPGAATVRASSTSRGPGSRRGCGPPPARPSGAKRVGGTTRSSGCGRPLRPRPVVHRWTKATRASSRDVRPQHVRSLAVARPIIPFRSRGTRQAQTRRSTAGAVCPAHLPAP